MPAALLKFLMEPTRSCRVCLAEKPETSFPRNRPDGSLHHRCLSCQALAYRQRYHGDAQRRAFQIAYSMNGGVARRFPEQSPVPAEVLVQLILETERCAYCAEPNVADGKGFQLDHITPLSKGGEHVLENLALCCAQCNRAKWNLTLEEFRAWLARVGLRQSSLNVL